MEYRVLPKEKMPLLPQCKASQVDMPFGTLTLVEAAETSANPICLVLPGFTGDAFTHTAFIHAANEKGLSCLCVTPKWGTSLNRIVSNNRSLIESLTLEPSIVNRIQFVRAVSFGSALSFDWLHVLRHTIKRVAWITPCSMNQIGAAARRMSITLNEVGSDQVSAPEITAPIRILRLEHDPIVPEVDEVFLKADPAVEVMTISGVDHFTAGESAFASNEIAEWFGAAT